MHGYLPRSFKVAEVYIVSAHPAAAVQPPDSLTYTRHACSRCWPSRAPGLNMALSVESLRRHFASHQVPHKRVYYWHAHTYCPEVHLHVGQQFRDKIISNWKEDGRISVHTMYNKAVGPHPHPNFETLFSRDAFADFITWLQFERPQELMIMIHPLTEQLVADHTTRALWLGQQPAGAFGGIKPEILVQMQQKAAEQGWTEEDFSERLKKH